DYGAFLPSMDLAYNVSDDVVLRFAASRTMTRPNPNLMISGVNFSDLSAQNVNLGNPQLKPFFSNNLDLGVEYYTGGAGYVGVTAFRKSLSGFPASTNVTEPFSYLSQFGINYAGLNVTQQTALNGRGCTSDTSCSATVTVVEQINQPGLEIINGLEFDYVQPFDFLLADYGLEGFGFNGNLTILDQRSTGVAPSFAAGVAPMSYNVTAYYDHSGLSVRLSYVFTDKSYGTGTSNNQNVCLPSTAAAPYCPGGAYLFTAPYGQADMSSSLALSKLFGELPTDPELTFDVQNIFKSKLRSYDQFTSATHYYYNQGSVFLFGIRGTW
ncbi:MAG TPA: TonB-dependent receptor, partial [Rhizomicrobium sp.]|nr:TonB-dependent receptor [Rhizomicrobium sp.]